MIRNTHIPVNGYMFSLLKIYAELNRLDCAETALEQIVMERIQQQPEIEDLSRRRAKAKKQADAEWREAHNITTKKQPTDDDQLP